MLDDMNVLTQKDSERTLDSSVLQPEQLSMNVEITHPPQQARPVHNIVFVGMGGSALAPEFVQAWLGDEIGRPIEVVKTYTLPGYVDENTLVFFASCSGNTEEVLEALESAKGTGAQCAVITGGGALAQQADGLGLSHVVLPPIKIQPRMLTFVQVRAIVALLDSFGVLAGEKHLAEMTTAQAWLAQEAQGWKKETPTKDNQAKQIALLAVGKNPEFMAGFLFRSLAYKWKISWNENAKNTAFWNYYPEFNHNEFIGWSSHPVDKPFAIFDLTSTLEHPRIQQRFAISNRLLSGKRPSPHTVELQGSSMLQQLCWGHLLADFASIYTGILNGVDPGPVPLVTKLKEELANQT